MNATEAGRTGACRQNAAELASQAIAARAITDDYTVMVNGFIDRGGTEPHWQEMYWRLSSELRNLTDALGGVLDAHQQQQQLAAGETGEAGKLAAIRTVLAAFEWEHDDRQYALERIDEIAGQRP
jgi:hypothetical protein